ncbi:lasso peptide biosynthesis B2 protein [[Pseudomonas] boreopolis]|uniref:lasso peptide biosynthesis B2 protein n=1 Tax=Xanthomonas boreopolis TaxID=86183 RepID=UPI003DA19E64
MDSLSLLRFLSRRELPANIVFGVTLAPFAAHCWVQAGDIVLNETLSDANAHTPIRMI